MRTKAVASVVNFRAVLKLSFAFHPVCGRRVASHTSRQWGSAEKNLLEKGLHEVTDNYTALKFTMLATALVLNLIL